VPDVYEEVVWLWVMDEFGIDSVPFESAAKTQGFRSVEDVKVAINFARNQKNML